MRLRGIWHILKYGVVLFSKAAVQDFGDGFYHGWHEGVWYGPNVLIELGSKFGAWLDTWCTKEVRR